MLKPVTSAMKKNKIVCVDLELKERIEMAKEYLSECDRCAYVTGGYRE